MKDLKHLIFDADDTLWENNIYYETAREKFYTLCQEYGVSRDYAASQFIQTETRIVQEKGYGTINFILILQTLYNQLLPAEAHGQFAALLNAFNNTISLPRTAIEGVVETLTRLKEKYHLYVLTKGDIEEQREKLDKSGLGDFFVEKFIVSEKNDYTYIEILKDKQWQSSDVCMIGNSPKSDINPALNAGMWAVFIPYAHTWFLEDEPLNDDEDKLIQIKKFKELENIL
jgi:putative hydrolase of the HAD superfamily